MVRTVLKKIIRKRAHEVKILKRTVTRSNMGAEGRLLPIFDWEAEEKGPSQMPPVNKELAEEVAEHP